MLQKVTEATHNLPEMTGYLAFALDQVGQTSKAEDLSKSVLADHPSRRCRAVAPRRPPSCNAATSLLLPAPFKQAINHTIHIRNEDNKQSEIILECRVNVSRFESLSDTCPRYCVVRMF